MALLLPESTEESPKTIMAGTLASILEPHVKKIMEKIIETKPIIEDTKKRWFFFGERKWKKEMKNTEI